MLLLIGWVRALWRRTSREAPMFFFVFRSRSAAPRPSRAEGLVARFRQRALPKPPPLRTAPLPLRRRRARKQNLALGLRGALGLYLMLRAPPAAMSDDDAHMNGNGNNARGPDSVKGFHPGSASDRRLLP